MKRLILVAMLVLLAVLNPGSRGGQARADSPPCQGLAPPVTFTHVVWVVMENRSYDEVTGGAAPYLDGLGCGQAANYHNITHPSLPNYVALTSGLPSTSLPTTDCYRVVCSVNAPSIFGQLDAAGISWATYAESMPSACYGRDERPYVVHHNPPPFYPDAAATCAENNLPLSAMDPLNLPAFTLIVPNVVNNMHENTSSVAAGDAWLSTVLAPILAGPQYQAGNTVVFVTWDEGSFPRHTRDCAANITDWGCHVLTAIIAESVPPWAVSQTLFNHYSLLRTTEELLGLPPLDQAATATSMRPDFALAAPSPSPPERDLRRFVR